ncbi:MAG TPA: RuBisCO large subunit C-terminal-like domain-containing protein [bacterium]|nr:RuBisCO large subunit C-terminal-like domain-containing protein [bacterium]
MISEKDLPGFFADKKDLKAEDYVHLMYRFETEIDPKVAAANLCCEQSTAQWARPGRVEDFRPKHGAKVVALTPDPSPEGGEGKAYRVTIAHPHRNFGPRIPNFLSAAAGEGPFYCPGIHFIKWTDFEFPESFLNQFEGPQFGLQGLRDMTGVTGRPFFVGVVKPNIGLTPKDFSEIAYQGLKGGLDIAKDDEMLADADWSPLKERARLAGEARKRAEEETGEKKIFISNVTDEVDALWRLHDDAVEGGANTVMINAIMTGISGLRALRRIAKVPVMSHFTGTAVFSRIPNFGISSLVAAKLQRLAGGDIIGLAGFGDRMGCTDEEVLANIDACLKPWGPIKSALPIPGGSDTPETLPRVYGKIGHADFGFICGRGVFGHPQGPAAGAKALRDAWGRLRSPQ